MSEHESPPAIAVLPSPYGWERKANSRWHEETGSKESRKVCLDSARKRPCEAQRMRRPMHAQASDSIQRFAWALHRLAAEDDHLVGLPDPATRTLSVARYAGIERLEPPNTAKPDLGVLDCATSSS